MPKPNPLDQLADNLAEWVLEVSDQMAEAIIGGMSAPFAAPVSEKDKLEYYTRQLFQPDGSPNYQGRVQEMQRLGPEQFVVVLKQVLKAHPQWKQPTATPPEGAAGMEVTG
jgi:hypothetical protein